MEEGKFMKVKCVKCKMEDELNEEDVKLVAHVVRKFNANPSPNDYTAVLSIIKGSNCVDNKKHIFIFEETFDRAVSDLIKNKKSAEIAKLSRKDALSKIESDISETNDKIRQLRSHLEDLQKEKNDTIVDIEKTDLLIEDAMNNFEKLTGATDIDIWS